MYYNKANETNEINEILNDYEQLTVASVYAALVGKNFETDREIAEFFYKEYVAHSEEFENTLSIANILTDSKILQNAKYYAKLMGESFDDYVSLAKYFQSQKRTPNFVKNMSAVSVLQDPIIMENAKFYAKIKQKSFDNPIDLAKYFQSQKEEPDFSETLNKAIKLKLKNLSNQTKR